MNSTWLSGPSWVRCRAWSALLAGWLFMGLALPVLAADNAVPRPPGLERDVQFWIRVYTEINTNSGFIHDDRNLGVVYETMKFSSSSPHEREKLVEDARERITAALRRLASASGGPLSADDQRIKDMWGGEGSPAPETPPAGGRPRLPVG